MNCWYVLQFKYEFNITFSSSIELGIENIAITAYKSVWAAFISIIFDCFQYFTTSLTFEVCSVVCWTSGILYIWISFLTILLSKSSPAVTIHVLRTLLELGNYYNWWSINCLSSSSEYFYNYSISFEDPIDLAYRRDLLIVVYSRRLVSEAKLPSESSIWRINWLSTVGLVYE